jgi:hypothetical protein
LEETAGLSGDFDGDGLADRPVVGLARCLPPASPPPEGTADYSVEVRYGDGRDITYPITACQSVCQAFAVGDVNDDGIDELFIMVDQGASSSFLAVFELQDEETSGGEATTVGLPDAPGFPVDEPALFEYGGSVTHQGFVTCVTPEVGGPEVLGLRDLLSTTAQLNHDQTEWEAHETEFTFDVTQNEGVPYTKLQVVSTRDYAEPFDPTGDQPFVPLGDSCWSAGP